MGILIDHDLKWHNHVSSIAQKLANAARILCTIRHYVNKSTLRSLYFSFVYPHLKYGIIVWGNSNKSVLQSLQVMQNKIILVVVVVVVGNVHRKKALNSKTHQLFLNSENFMENIQFVACFI